MKTLSQKILGHAAALPEGAILWPKELLHLGDRAAVDQTLSRLHRRGKLMRISRGMYVLPVESWRGRRSPSPVKIIASLSETTGEVIVPHGAMAANALGLTTQVPVRSIYLTSGPNRRLEFGSRVVELRRVPRWQLILPGQPVGEAVRALNWLGPSEAERSVSLLSMRLPPQDLETLTALRPHVPTWMAEALSSLVTMRGKHHPP